MSDAVRPTGVDTPDIEPPQKRCRVCGYTDVVGRRKVIEVGDREMHIVVCPDCGSGRWGSDTVRRIAGVTDPGVDP